MDSETKHKHTLHHDCANMSQFKIHPKLLAQQHVTIGIKQNANSGSLPTPLELQPVFPRNRNCNTQNHKLLRIWLEHEQQRPHKASNDHPTQQGECYPDQLQTPIQHPWSPPPRPIAGIPRSSEFNSTVRMDFFFFEGKGIGVTADFDDPLWPSGDRTRDIESSHHDERSSALF